MYNAWILTDQCAGQPHIRLASFWHRYNYQGAGCCTVQPPLNHGSNAPGLSLIPEYFRDVKLQEGLESYFCQTGSALPEAQSQ